MKLSSSRSKPMKAISLAFIAALLSLLPLPACGEDTETLRIKLSPEIMQSLVQDFRKARIQDLLKVIEVIRMAHEPGHDPDDEQVARGSMIWFSINHHGITWSDLGITEKELEALVEGGQLA